MPQVRQLVEQDVIADVGGTWMSRQLIEIRPDGEQDPQRVR